MFEESEYRLLDFGEGQKLESFGGVRVCRPSPVATGKPTAPINHNGALFFDGERSLWTPAKPPVEQWLIRFRGIRFQLKPTPFGHLGVFPEQADNWEWLSQMQAAIQGRTVLNLFAYTGGTTMAMAKMGGRVSHIDAAQNVVNWARENARESGLAEAPIRWIAEDAMRFIEREIRRERRYEIIVADPPSFGRGPKKETWKLQRDLDLLLEKLVVLTGGRPQLVLLSCHTPGFDRAELQRRFEQHFGRSGFEFGGGPMALSCADGRKLPAGHCLRVMRSTN